MTFVLLTGGVDLSVGAIMFIGAAVAGKLGLAGQPLWLALEGGRAGRRVLAAVYLISGGCAAVGGILTLGQLGSVSPKFGDSYEFKAIAAAVLGGTSLFGGRGAVLPGTVLGAVLIQSVDNGLVILNADPYLYPLITSGVIFLAVMIDSARNTLLERAPRLLHRFPES